jgi:demethylmenaquinone methyltransferase/2-methoxy-6-polyprenyl-1,4-benzoquinol methylase
VIEISNPRQDSKILDICTGTGEQALEFGKQGYEVIGIDLSEEMLKIAKRKNKYKNVKFEIGDATNIPFQSNSFDISCISFGLHEMPKEIIERALSEIKRVTKFDGKIIIIDYALPKNKPRLFNGVNFNIKKVKFDKT